MRCTNQVLIDINVDGMRCTNQVVIDINVDGMRCTNQVVIDINVDGIRDAQTKLLLISSSRNVYICQLHVVH